ncbi:MAG TPA: ATP synthase F1 subunit delta [Dissulfurispiraceae bacterium]|nr:ATP synthase F1 subunit delta [Dissulfurispiraceae bacterium]
MKKIKGVKRYAKQFLSAVDLTEVPQGLGQLSAIANLMDKDKSFRNLMISPVFSGDEIGRIISYLSVKLKMSAKTSKYLQYLVEAGAIGALSEIIIAIQSQYFEIKKRSKAVVTTSVQVGKDYEVQLSELLQKVTGGDIDLEFVLDPSLLGGVTIKVGSTLYDSSIKGQLGLLKDKLIKG